jgi:hypothetical protein
MQDAHKVPTVQPKKSVISYVTLGKFGPPPLGCRDLTRRFIADGAISIP